MFKIVAGIPMFIYGLTKLEVDFESISNGGFLSGCGSLFFHLSITCFAVYLLYTASNYILLRKNVIKDIINDLSFNNSINVGQIARKNNLTEKNYDCMIRYAKNIGILDGMHNETNRVFTSNIRTDTRRKKIIVDAFEDAVYKLRNAAILGLVIVLYPLLLKYDVESYPVVLGIIFFVFSILYHFMFEKNQIHLPNNAKDNYLKNVEISNLINERVDKLTPIIKNIFGLLDNIKKIHSSKYSIISERMCDIIEFEQVVPLLVRSYRNASDFIGDREDITNSEIIRLNAKLPKILNEVAKENIRMAITQKKEILDEILMMEKNMEDCESTLDFILSALQKIETIIHVALVSNNLSAGQTDKLREQFDVFSNTLRNVSKNLKL